MDKIQAIYDKGWPSTMLTPEQKAQLEAAFEKAGLNNPYFNKEKPEVKKLNKYDIAEVYLETQERCNDFNNQLPQGLEQAFFDNEAYQANEQLVHILLKQLLTEPEFDDLMYFAFESNPCVEVDGQDFHTVQEYWEYLDEQVKN